VEGLWQQVGKYWWLGMNAGSPEAAWTGKHDEHGTVFPASIDRCEFQRKAARYSDLIAATVPI